MGLAGGAHPFASLRTTVVVGTIFHVFAKNGHFSFANKAQIAIFWIFFKNGSPGQMAMLDRSGSNFCAETRISLI